MDVSGIQLHVGDLKLKIKMIKWRKVCILYVISKLHGSWSILISIILNISHEQHCVCFKENCEDKILRVRLYRDTFCTAYWCHFFYNLLCHRPRSEWNNFFLKFLPSSAKTLAMFGFNLFLFPKCKSCMLIISTIYFYSPKQTKHL